MKLHAGVWLQNGLQRWIILALLAFSIVGASVMVALLATSERNLRHERALRARSAMRDQAARRVAFAESTLLNCQQIELVKGALRITIQAGLKEVPAYYRGRPDELRRARERLRVSVARFAPIDCYKLPAVTAAGLLRPRPWPDR